MPRVTIVSAADELYYPLLKGLVLSIQGARPDRLIALSVINLGMNPIQLQELTGMGVSIVPGRWDFDFPGREASPRWMQGQLARSRFPDYFPNFDTYIWIDADAWLQDWRGIELLLAASERGALAVVPEIHRSYPGLYRIRSTQRWNEIYTESFGDEVAAKLSDRPIFNSGVFACRKESTVWKTWAKWMQTAVAGIPHKLTEQNALNAAIYLDDFPFVPLPAWCNWVCGQSRPVFNPGTGLLCESLAPFDPLSIIHVTPRQIVPTEVSVLGRAPVTINLDYLPFQAARATVLK
jgi:hypothetical protein